MSSLKKLFQLFSCEERKDFFASFSVSFNIFVPSSSCCCFCCEIQYKMEKEVEVRYYHLHFFLGGTICYAACRPWILSLSWMRGEKARIRTHTRSSNFQQDISTVRDNYNVISNGPAFEGTNFLDFRVCENNPQVTIILAGHEDDAKRGFDCAYTVLYIKRPLKRLKKAFFFLSFLSFLMKERNTFFTHEKRFDRRKMSGWIRWWILTH